MSISRKRDGIGGRLKRVWRVFWGRVALWVLWMGNGGKGKGEVIL